MYIELAILALFIFCYSLVAGRLERAAASGPMVFVLAGLLMGPLGLGWFDGDASRTALRVLADLTLALVLFIDAANADFAILKRQYRIPLRMLLLGLPGAIFLGTLLAALLFDTLSLFEAAILGTVLAATDAALGKAVISNKSVPPQIREGLNIESGLNDGLCVPILFVFIAMALGNASEGGLALKLVAEEIGIGLAVGLSLSAAGTLDAEMVFEAGLGDRDMEASYRGGAGYCLLFGCPEPTWQWIHRCIHRWSAFRLQGKGGYPQAGTGC